ncbi:unnamed protein product [Paramecium sonneborni]|uniref:HECT domain-containing protein n=1 Tax=Paramecium sonneborni TaxID=65129 RepID=A0A8S1QP84_9CILI|nr:unnamed protein product [Paramecium sonneborni]
MGCGVSTKINIQDPDQNNDQSLQIDNSNNQQQDIQQIEANQQDTQEQQDGIRRILQEDIDLPCKKPKPKQTDNNIDQIQFEPSLNEQSSILRNERLQKLIKFGREYVKLLHRNSETEQQIINEIEQLIFSNQLTLQELNKISKRYDKSLLQILFLKGCQGITLLELILIYIEDFSIITHLLQEHYFPINDDFYFVAIRIINKIKPLRKNDIQVQQSIEFIKTISNFNQINQLAINKEAHIIFNGVTNFGSEFNLKNQYHVQLLNAIVKLFKKFQIHSSLEYLYKTAKIDKNFTNLSIPKSIPKGECNYVKCYKIELEFLKMNLFHWIALKNEWNLFKQYANNYYQQPDISGQTPFMIFTEKAPLRIILEYITTYPSQLKQAINYSTFQGKNILHCISMNKNISETNLNEIIKIFNHFESQESLKKLLYQSFYDQIPLISYLDSHKQILNPICQFLSQFIIKEFDFNQFIVQAVRLSHLIKQTKYKDLKENQKSEFIKLYDRFFYYKKIKVEQKDEEIDDESDEDNKKKNEKKILIKQIPQPQILTEEDFIYLHYIQLVKQVIKKDFKVNFDWINNFNIYTSYFPNDIGTAQQTFMNILLRNGHQEKVKSTITQMIQQINSNMETNNPNMFSLKAYLLAQLISLKKEQKQYPNQELFNRIDSIVIEQISQNPILLITQIFGNTDFRSLEHQTIYSLLIQLNDQKLLKKCLSAELLFDIDQKTKYLILNTAFELKQLNSKDNLLNKIIDSIQIKAKIRLIKYFFQITLNNNQQEINNQEDNTINFKTLIYLDLQDYDAKKAIIKQILQKDQKNDEFHYFRAYISYKNILVFNQNIESQKTFLEMLKSKPSLFLNKFWSLKDEFNFNPEILNECEVKKKFTIFDLKFEHYEKAFDWQICGILAKIQNSQVPTNINISNLSHKQNVILIQISQKISFVEALAQSNKLNQEFQNFMLSYQKEKKFIKPNLVKMIEAEAFNNIQFISNWFQLSLDELIALLANQYFLFEINGKQKAYTHDNQIVEQFNQQLQKLLEIQISQYEQNQGVKYNFSNIIQLISLQNWKMLDEKTKNSIYKTINKESLIDLIYSEVNIEVTQSIIIDILSKGSIELIQMVIKHCTKSLPKNSNIINLIINLALNIENKDEETIILLEKLYVSFFSHNENQALQYLHKIKLQRNKIYYLYGLVLKKSQSIQTLNELLFYCENNSLNLDNQIYKVPLKCPENLENYYKALSKQYQLVFTISQYQEFCKQVVLTTAQKIKHLNSFIVNGLYEKLQFLLRQTVFDFETYSTTYFQIIKSYLEEQLNIKFENIYGDQKDDYQQADNDENGNENILKNNKIQFFDLQQNNIQFKKLRNKRSEMEIKDEAQKIVQNFCRVNNINLLQKLFIKKVHKIQQNISYQQSKFFGEQKQDRSVLFMSSGGQKTDYLKCIELIQKQFIPKKVKSKTILANYELYSQLLNPKNKKIKKSQEIIQILLSIFEKNKSPNAFLTSRAQGYIDLYNANINSKQFKVEFQFPQKFSQFQKQFFLEILLTLKNESQNETANLILRQQHENIRCVKFLQKYLIELENKRFNNTTLFYITKKVDILKNNSYPLNELIYNKNSEQIKTQFYNMQYTTDELNKNQVYLRKGRHDHITKKQQFSQNHLVSAIMGNNYTSIIYALNLHIDPVNCALSNNVFQILIIQQCEVNIIEYFKQFIKGKVNAYEKLLTINEIPILYYIFYKKMERVFKECFLDYLINLLGKEQANNLIKIQLQLSSILTEYKIYQIALLNKCYYILNYLDEIITQEDLILVNSPLNFVCQNVPQDLEENSKEDLFYKKYFDLLQLASQQLYWCQYEKLKKKDQKQKNLKEENKKKAMKKKKQINKKGKKSILSKEQAPIKKYRSLYIRDKQLNELILFEQACLNSVFKLKAQINLKNKLLSLELSDNKLECLDKYQYPEEMLKYFIQGTKIKDELLNYDENQVQNFLKNCFQYQIIHNHIVLELLEINPLLLLKVLQGIHFTLEVAVILYIKLKDTLEFDNFLSYHIKMYTDYIRIPEHVVPIEGEVIRQEVEHPKLQEYMKPSVAYILMLLNSIKQDKYDSKLLNQKYISTPLFQRTYDLIKQYTNQQKLIQMEYTSNTLQFLKDFSQITLNIENSHFYEKLISEENCREATILKSIIIIKEIEAIVYNFKTQCQMYLKEKKQDKQCKKIFQVYFGNENIQILDDCFWIYLTIENNQIILDQTKIDKVLEFLSQKKHQKQLEQQPVLMEQLLKVKFEQMKQVNQSKFDFTCLNLVDFENLPYEDLVDKILQLIIPLEKCGQYEIDDLFAPHQHEQIRQPELTQQISIQQPVLQRQQSSQIGALGLTRQVSTSQRQKLKEDFQFMLELLPDNTYQVRQRHQKLNQKEIIFSEFYQFQQPNIKLNLIKLSKSEFIQQYNTRKVISIVVQNLYKYNEYLGNLIEGQSQQEDWIIDFPFYILDNQIKFSECLFATQSIQFIYNKLFKFIEQVFLLSENDKKDNKKLIWRINAISFLEVFISKIIDLQNQEFSCIEIYSLINSLLQWKSLAMILNTLIYHNLEQAQQVLKVIRGVYVEFNEIHDLAQQNCQFIDTNSIFDKTFLFGNTSYLLQNQMLIIRLNVKIESNTQQIIEIKNNLMISDSRIQLYYNNILNIYDFFNQIFSADQLVQFIFNKLEVDRCLLNFSNKISQFISKTITLSVDHFQLVQIFSNEILRAISIKNNETKYRELENIWYILNELYGYFTRDLYNYLVNQYLTEKFNNIFYIRFSCLLNSIKYKKNVNEIINSNVRQIIKSDGRLVLEKVGNLNKQITKKLYFKFGFQLITSFYISNCKLGDICAVCHYKNSSLNLFYGQLVCNTKPGFLIFHNLKDNSAKSQEEIVRLQQAYIIGTNIQDQQQINLEELNSIILFQSSWPNDPLFNNSILNLFFTNFEQDLFICNEQNFIRSMIEIQNEIDENVKQDKLDDLFGIGLTSSYSDITITQMTPTFVDQINFDFISMNVFRRQQSAISPNTVFVRINENQFELDPLPTQNINTACYFESNVKSLKLLGKLNNFIIQHKEFHQIYLIFDDELDQFAIQASERIIIENSGIISFIKGYEQFITNQKQNQINSSLQMFFEVESISSIKINIIKNLISKVEIIFAPYKEDHETLIKLQNQTLQIYSFLEDTKMICPEIEEISNFFFNLIINFQTYNLDSFLLNENKIQIIFNTIPEQDFVKIFVDIMLIAQYLHKLLCIIDKENQIKVINIKNTTEIITKNKYSFYQFIDEQIIFNYFRYNDFSFSDFILDYLNRNQINQQFKYEYQVSYSGPQLLQQPLILNPREIFQDINQQDQIELLSILDRDIIIKNQEKANPQEFKELILIPIINGFYINLFYFKSFQHPILKEYNNQEKNEFQVEEEIRFLINPINSQIDLDQQVQKIKIKVKYGKLEKKKYNLSQLLYKKQEQESLMVKGQFLTKNFMLVTIKSHSRMKIDINYNLGGLSYQNYQFSKHVKFDYQIQTVQVLENTIHVSVQHDLKNCKVEHEKEEHSTYGKGDRILMKIVSKKVKENRKEQNIYQQFETLTHSKELQTGNTINIISNQDIAVATRAGVLRKDYIEFKDANYNSVEQFSFNRATFVHSLFYQIQYVPNQERIDYGLNLIWTPTFKGIYHLFIDDVKIDGRFIVLANVPDVEKSKIEIQDNLDIIPFCERIQISFYLKDEFENCYGDIENQIFNDSNCNVKKASGNQSKLNLSQNNLTKIGCLNINILFEPLDILVLEDQVILDFFINNQLKKSQKLKLQGLGLEKRKQRLQDDINQVWKPTRYDLNISRVNFLEDLLELTEKRLNYSFSIKFANEPGIDAGGLKREFYDMIGNTLKDENYKFFSPVSSNQSKYFLHPKFNKQKNKERYALLFGKLIANAIGNSYLIGIDIIAPFWKVVFDEQIVFSDLSLIWDKNTYNNYEKLKSLSEEELESVCLVFTYSSGNTEIELITKGSQTNVSQKNLELYLNKTAEYVIYKQFDKIYKSFIEGFQSILDIQICKKWLMPYEMSLLTQGLLEIKSDILLQKFHFSGGKPQHKSYFETYITQASSETLKNMLKFITGSSSIPFDQSSYVITVRFEQGLSDRKLPLSHTCFKSIEVPLYKSFTELKQKLDIAFTIGFEGYAFG